jgi:DNA-binding response OmpR family regulator
MRHIMVVDDEPALCRLLTDALSPEFRVSCAGSVAEALRLLAPSASSGQATGIALAVIDVVLPDGSGLAVAREAMRAGIVPLVVSGHPEECRRLEAAGMPCLVKPFRLAALEARIAALLIDGAAHGRAMAAALDALGGAV